MRFAGVLSIFYVPEELSCVCEVSLVVCQVAVQLVDGASL